MPKALKKIAVIASIMLVMTGLMNSVMTYFARTEGQGFLEAWLPAWAMVGLLVAPVGFTLFWALGKFLDQALPNVPVLGRTVLQGIIMAFLMEGFMASVTAYQLQGFGNGFADVWLRALLAGLPVAAVMGVLGTFVIKPRMDAYMAS